MLPPLDEDSAARLFEARAAAVGVRLTADDRASVHRLVGALDGLPLAIELAAAQTLRAAIECGFTLDAAEAILDLRSGTAIDAVRALHDHSMLQSSRGDGDVRFSLFDSVRELASPSSRRTASWRTHRTVFARVSSRRFSRSTSWPRAMFCGWVALVIAVIGCT